MKKLMIVLSLLLTFLSSDFYGQYGPWGRRVPPPRQPFPVGRPITPPQQIRIITREAARRAWEIQRRQIEDKWEQDRIVRERYGNALRRERETQRQAEYAERYFPNTAISRSYRQAAEAARSNRIRNEVIYNVRTRESVRRWGVTSTAPGWMRSRQAAGTGGRQSPQSRKGDLPVSRGSGNRRDATDWSSSSRSSRSSGERYIDRMASRPTQQPRISDQLGRSPRIDRKDMQKAFDGYINSKALDRNVGNGTSRRSAPQRRDSSDRSRSDNSSRSDRSSNTGASRSSGDGKTWRDTQREWSDRKP